MRRTGSGVRSRRHEVAGKRNDGFQAEGVRFMRYKDGTEVREGDVVFIRDSGVDVPGLVLKIIFPGTAEANQWSAGKGGVLIEGGGLGLSLSESLENDEDVRFVRRKND
jgi:hypothetical protein